MELVMGLQALLGLAFPSERILQGWPSIGGCDINPWEYKR